MSDENKTKEELEKLTEALEASAKTIEAPVLQIEDLNEQASKYLTPNARYDLTRKSKNTMVVEDDNVYKAVYFAARVKKGNQDKALQSLSRVVNKLSEQGMIHSFLSGFASIDLAVMPMEAPQSVVFIFPLVPANAEFNVRHRFKNLAILEGGMAEAIEDVSADREEGEFFSVVRISSHAMVSERNLSPKDLLDEEISKLLAVLPRGTVVRNISTCAVTDLSVPYEVKFFHPFMKDIKRVELNYVRTISKHPHGIEQFNLLVGVSYYDHSDRLLFRENR